jgi:hypothetical protein
MHGVDINEESVEIAKLSLWLRTARPNRKLNNLNNNIKCGNSLIDDPKIAGLKAFDWSKEFPMIEGKGGFDVVIGNPPYGILIDKETQFHYTRNFPLTRYKTNLYVLFLERMLQIFESGTFFFIIPKSLLFNSYYDAIRRELLHKTEINEVYTITEKVFEDAEVGGSLLLKFTLKEAVNIKNKVRLASARKIHNFISGSGILENFISQDYFLEIPNYEISVISSTSQSVVEKLKRQKTIGDFYKLRNGLNPGNIKHILISKTADTNKHRPIIWGKDISKYRICWSGDFINYDTTIGQRINLNDIRSKDGMNKQSRIDFALREPQMFDTRKIVLRKTGDSLIASIDELGFCFDTLAHGIYQKEANYTLEFLVAILNSNPATQFYRLLHDIKGKVFAKISLDNVSAFPFPICSSNDIAVLEHLAKKKSVGIEIFNRESSKFEKMLLRKFELKEVPKKLKNWYLQSYTEFTNNLAKSKMRLSLYDEAEWQDYFESESKKLVLLKATLTDIDNNIDAKVYHIYNIIPEEVELIDAIE